MKKSINACHKFQSLKSFFNHFRTATSSNSLLDVFFFAAFCILFGDRIIAARMEGMTAQDPLETHPYSPSHSKTFDGLQTVLRTAGNIPAMRFAYTSCFLVQSDQKQAKPTHSTAALSSRDEESPFGFSHNLRIEC